MNRNHCIKLTEEVVEGLALMELKANVIDVIYYVPAWYVKWQEALEGRYDA